MSYEWPMPATELPPLTPETTLGEVLRYYPGAQRALFARYHIGGCSSCAFSPTETLAQVCSRNENIPVAEMIQHIHDSHSQDDELQISPRELAELMKNEPNLQLLDARTREEHEAVKIPGAQFMDQELVQQAFSNWDKNTPIVLYDHTGSRSLDAVAYYIGHGFTHARCLTGGIDAYSQQIDPTLPRYHIEIEA
jgi:rhodanese-related sulfurtransferase